MSKPYFAMMLPSEETFTHGDDTFKRLSGEPKLYLCTKDIKVGDKVYEKLTDGTWMGWVVDNLNDLDIPNQVKIIGEISPNALSYVKEGDEFDEDKIAETMRYWHPEYGFSDEHFWEGSDKQEKRKVVIVKGPCGHFH